MALAEEQLKEIALAEWMHCEHFAERNFAFEFAKRLIAALPKPEPVGALKELGKRLAARLDEDDWNYIEPFLRECEAPIAPPASECKCSMTTKLVGDGCAHCNPEYAASAAQPASEQKPEDFGLIVTSVPVVFEETDRDKAYDTIDRFLRNNLDDEEYAEYSDALETVLAPQPDYKAQRDAERYRFLRDSQEGKTIRIKPRLLWNEEIDAASASVKGGA